MARIRTLKPEAPQHRKVGRLSIWARWLWVVMITQADDEGRLVADPGQLRVIAFGYDKPLTDGRVMQCLEEIQATGMIRLYTVEGTLYADFPSWTDHQRISHPCHSKLPEYQDSGTFRNPPESSSTIKDQGSDQGSRKGRDNTSPRPEEVWPSPGALVALYNTTAPDECPEVTKLSPARSKKAQNYLAAFPDRAFWEETFGQIRASRFLRGLRPSSNGHEHFVADFDWLLTKGKDGSENCVKVYEGKYHD